MRATGQGGDESKYIVGDVDIWGRPVRYTDYGSDNAAETIFVFNGIGANVQSAERFQKSFTRSRVITFDAPGVGATPTPTLPYRMRFVANTVDRLLAKLGLDQVHVFGASWGGAAAQQFARNYPHRCKSLTLAATSAGLIMIPGTLNTLAKLITPKRHADPNFMLRNAQALYGGTIAIEQELLREFAEALEHKTPVGYAYQLMAISGWTSWHYLPFLDLPALILMGEDDPIVPIANGRLMARRLPNATLKVLPCGHLFIVTMTQQTAEHVENFVQNLY